MTSKGQQRPRREIVLHTTVPRLWVDKHRCDDETISRCKRSIIGQCAFYNFSRPLRERVIGTKRLTETEIEQTARHIARFSLGGLHAINEEGQS